MSIVEKYNQQPKQFVPQSSDRNNVATAVLSRIRELRDVRAQSFKILRDRTIGDFWDDSIKRFVQFKQRPAHKEPWQANTASSAPADKLIGILSKLASQAMEARVRVTNESSIFGRKVERVLNVLLKAAGRKNNDDYQVMLEMMAAMAKGTVVGYEGWKFGKREIREVTDIDPETGRVKFRKKVIFNWNDVIGEIVPIENFYPGNVFVRPGKVSDMNDCAVRKVISYTNFESEYGKYPDAGLVVPKGLMRVSGDTEELFYKTDVDVKDDEVEIWTYFNQVTDELVMLANGIWINPVGTSDTSPLPWNHKQLPFWSAVFEPLAEDFFYGRSLPDKLISMTDMQDALFDRILDQLAISVHRPILTRKGSTSITRGFMHPGAVIEVKGSRPVSQEFSTLPVEPPSQVHFQMLQILEQRIERASIASEVSSGASSGTRKTATQVLQEREAAVELVSLFLKICEFAVRDKQTLRLKNIIQFYTLPVHKSMEEARFRQIILREERLSTGEVGTVDLAFTDNDIASEQAAVEQKRFTSAEPIEVIRLSPSFIRNADSELEIVPQSSVKQTESVLQAGELNFQKVMAELFPDKVNRDSMFEDAIRVFNKDITRLRAATPQEKQDVYPGTENGQGGTNALEGVAAGLGPALSDMAAAGKARGFGIAENTSPS